MPRSHLEIINATSSNYKVFIFYEYLWKIVALKMAYSGNIFEENNTSVGSKAAAETLLRDMFTWNIFHLSTREHSSSLNGHVSCILTLQ